MIALIVNWLWQGAGAAAPPVPLSFTVRDESRRAIALQDRSRPSMALSSSMRRTIRIESVPSSGA